ncbi:hypothetical protein L6452_24638 [Arctium lappa]|uniref:Uncharacterized protein n=1 Tax=Arctium lappa TaxID=4217 RepID=A0ACB9A9C0_ARCLA|nr:hypothetical protein L6452_24638 [Arctium lappa]
MYYSIILAFTFIRSVHIWVYDRFLDIGLNLIELQSDPTSPDECLAEPVRPTVHSFCKVLTASDTSTHRRRLFKDGDQRV